MIKAIFLNSLVFLCNLWPSLRMSWEIGLLSHWNKRRLSWNTLDLPKDMANTRSTAPLRLEFAANGSEVKPNHLAIFRKSRAFDREEHEFQVQISCSLLWSDHFEELTWSEDKLPKNFNSAVYQLKLIRFINKM